jgi:hypothetical protein
VLLMAGVTLGFLKYVLGLDSLAFRKGISQADADLAKMQKGFAAKGKEIEHLGRSLSTFVTAPLAGLATVGVHLAQQQVNAMAQVQAALKSTGGIAGVTAGQLKKASESFEVHSLFESQDVLKDVSARLLAFGSVHGATFNRAQQDILDYAQRTGKDLGAATVLIGKSLENPAKAAGALFKAGVTLTDGQKALIKQFAETGNAAGAQNIILTALETKYRGAAQAAADVDPYHNAHVALKQLSETIGGALLPLIPPLTNAVASVARAFTSLSPTTQKWLIIIGGVALVLGPLLVGLGSLVTIVAASGPLVAGIAALASGLSLTAIAEGAAAAAAVALDVALSPVILVVGAVALAVGAAYLAWKNWDKVKAIVAGVADWVSNHVGLVIAALGPFGVAISAVVGVFKHWDQIKTIVASVYNAVKTWLVDKFNAIVVSIKGKVDAVIGFFRDLWDKVVGHSYVPDTVDAIGKHFGRLGEVMVEPTKKATAAAIASFQKLKDDVSELLDQLFPEEARQREQLDQLKTLDDAYKAHIITLDRLVDAQARVTGTAAPFTVDIPGGSEPLDQLPGGLDADMLDKLLPKMATVVDSTQRWKDLLSDVGTQLSSMIGDDLARIVEGSRPSSRICGRTCSASRSASSPATAASASYSAARAQAVARSMPPIRLPGRRAWAGDIPAVGRRPHPVEPR